MPLLLNCTVKESLSEILEDVLFWVSRSENRFSENHQVLIPVETCNLINPKHQSVCYGNCLVGTLIKFVRLLICVTVISLFFPLFNVTNHL